MLTIAPGCACDVCAEEYGPHRLPHSIPCGHVLCASCCTTIVEKTSPRLSPVCPFCREPFTHDSARLIRMDFVTSGWSTPRRFPAMETFNDFNSERWRQGRIEVRRLEDKVAKVAAKKCSVEEVSTLYKELEDWLLRRRMTKCTSSILLSAALLRAILMNHLAHSDASKTAKTTEANLKNKIEDLENNNTKMEAEMRRQRSQYNQKSQECQQLRNEVAQLRTLATTLGVSAPEMPSSVPTSPTPSPTPYSSSQSPYSPSSSTSTTGATASPLSRFNAMHTRSASMSSRPTTPATPLSPTRSHTPAPPRSHTPAPSTHAPLRSHTPGPGHSSASAAAAALSSPPRSHTPGPAPSTPAPLVPPKPRRLSTPSPPKMMVRSTSEEKAEAHERWLPPNMSPDDDYVLPRDHHHTAKEKERIGLGLGRSGSVRPASRAGFVSRLGLF
ncbi:hypothetical protein CPB84DRAFT_1816953 [Gymnopilus junonius]|uniref:RING-type domain-containing protein n=1 Tax=Gymnopilus junonius TaxID=109634 RepID=A0A9P5NGS2_GYMJU|nr:hypothetical protein CPB84DRAFT_1816953 [Gymnopilus junonius]